MSTESDSAFVTWWDILDRNVPDRQSEWPRLQTEVCGLFTLYREDIEIVGKGFGRNVAHPQPFAAPGLASCAGDVARGDPTGPKLRPFRDRPAVPWEAEADALPSHMTPMCRARHHFLPDVTTLRDRDGFRQGELRGDAIQLEIDSLEREAHPDPPRLEGSGIDRSRDRGGV